MKLTGNQVKHVAKLANLPLTSEEEDKYSEQLSNILDYFEQLNQVDTTGVESTFNVTDQSNVMREDETNACLTSDEASSNASQKKDGFFITKGIFEE